MQERFARVGLGGVVGVLRVVHRERERVLVRFVSRGERGQHPEQRRARGFIHGGEHGDADWEVAPQMDVAVGPGMDVPSIPDFVLYPVRTDQSRPVAVFLDGYKFHADETSGHNRVARDVQQRQALVHSRQYWVWNFSWEDIQFRNDPAKIPATLTGETQAHRRNDMARQLLTGDELSLAQSVGSYTSWTLFLEFLARPNPAFWEKLSYLYALTLPGQLQPVSLEKATSALSKLCHGSHELSAFTVVQPADGLGGACTSDEVSALTLMTNSSVKDRNVSGVFFLLSFDDDRNVREPDFPRHWRGFLRLLNRLQFLPLAHVITVRGCHHGVFSGIPDAYRHFLAGGGPSRPTAPSPEPDTAGTFPSDFDLAYPGHAPFLRQVLQQKLTWPVIGFELEANGRVAATAETAWPDYQVALLGTEFTADQEAFMLAGWRVFIFGTDGLLPQDAATLVTLLTSSK